LIRCHRTVLYSVLQRTRGEIIASSYRSRLALVTTALLSLVEQHTQTNELMAELFERFMSQIHSYQ